MVSIPAAIEAYFALVGNIPESCFGAKAEPKRLLSQFQEPEFINDPFLLLDGQIVDKIVIVALVSYFSYEEGVGST